MLIFGGLRRMPETPGVNGVKNSDRVSPQSAPQLAMGLGSAVHSL